MDWLPFLNSKVRGDGFADLSGDQEAASKWLHRNKILQEHIFRASDRLPPDAKTSYYLAESEGEYVICALGDVAHHLGKKHPQSVDRKTPEALGRRKPFILGYKASGGPKIPSLQDLEGMHDIITRDLERMFEDAERTYPHYRGGESFRTHLPASGIYGDNAWDRAAQTIGRGESINGMVVSQEGGLQSIPFAPPVTVGSTEPKGMERLEEIRAAGHQTPKKKLEKTLKWGGVVGGVAMVLHSVFAIHGSLSSANGHNPREDEGKWTKIILHGMEALTGAALAVFSWRR